METVADVVAAGRDRDGVVLSVPGRTTGYRYDDFCTNVWKSGNLMRHYGLRAGAEAAVAVGPKDGGGDRSGSEGRAGWLDAADPLLAVLAAAQLGASVDLDPADDVDARVFVLPAAWADRYDPGPGTTLVAYGGPPEESEVVHFERERWSENPMQPPDPPSADDGVLAGYTHGDLVGAAGRVADEYGLTDEDTVVLATPLAGRDVAVAGALAAGVLAPMRVGARVVAGGTHGDGSRTDGDGTAPAVVVGADGGLDPADVVDR